MIADQSSFDCLKQILLVKTKIKYRDLYGEYGN